MKKICLITTTRAEYSLLKPLIILFRQYVNVDLKVVVTGTHLLQSFGNTYKQIEDEGIHIDEKIKIFNDDFSAVSICKYMGNALAKFAEYFSKEKPDMIIILGDRYETMAICCAAYNMQIPIAHLHGGETTEGSLDEAYRHSITKMSYLHFTSTEEYRRRVVQLGEDPKKVFNFGAIGVENIKKVKLLPKKELEKALDLKLNRPYAIATFHPVLLESYSVSEQIDNFLAAISKFPDIVFIFTKANADEGGNIVNEKIRQYIMHHDNAVLFDSLGLMKYFSAIKYSRFVIGNSSSGIIEVPSLKKPTVNIGDRQKGRVQSNSILNCKPLEKDIVIAINKALCMDSENIVNPYEKKNTSAKIVKTIIKYINKPIILQRQFYNIKWEE